LHFFKLSLQIKENELGMACSTSGITNFLSENLHGEKKKHLGDTGVDVNKT
jgi:hypothetical protein